MRSSLLFLIILAVCAVLWLPLSVIADEDTTDTPETAGQRIIERARRDCGLLFPQTGLGGDPEAKMPRPTDKEADFLEFKVESEGNNGMVAFKYVLKNPQPGKKYPLMFTFHGNGELGSSNVRNLGPLLLGSDPCYVCGMQYQLLEADGKPKFNNPRNADMPTTSRAARWVLEKMLKDHPIDPDRVFAGGFSMGTSYSSAWALHEWQRNRDEFPLRGLFLFSSPGMVQRDAMPPIPVICTVGSDETAVLGTINVVENVRQYCNLLFAWGLPCQYHEIPGMGHAVNARCICIARDVINLCGGPGLQWKPPGSQAAMPEPLPFKGDDAITRELISLCNADDWAGAQKRIEEIWSNKKLKTKERQPAKDFEKEMDKFARSEITRLEKEVDKALKAQEMPRANQAKRLRALVAAYDGASWLKGKDPLAGLRKTESADFPPGMREAERAKMMSDALEYERTEGKRGEARKLYEALAKRKNEDKGASIWPKAAEFRLTWWIKGRDE